VRRIDVRGNIGTIAQTATPLGVAVDAQGRVYVAAADGNRVLRIGD
jgi:DNA-binding beta-propeller fold protein YncE